jgi:hypothetical protein
MAAARLVGCWSSSGYRRCDRNSRSGKRHRSHTVRPPDRSSSSFACACASAWCSLLRSRANRRQRRVSHRRVPGGIESMRELRRRIDRSPWATSGSLMWLNVLLGSDIERSTSGQGYAFRSWQAPSGSAPSRPILIFAAPSRVGISPRSRTSPGLDSRRLFRRSGRRSRPAHTPHLGRRPRGSQHLGCTRNTPRHARSRARCRSSCGRYRQRSSSSCRIRPVGHYGLDRPRRYWCRERRTGSRPAFPFSAVLLSRHPSNSCLRRHGKADRRRGIRTG